MATKKPKVDNELPPEGENEQTPIAEVVEFAVEKNHHGAHHKGAYRGEVPIPPGRNSIETLPVIEDDWAEPKE